MTKMCVILKMACGIERSTEFPIGINCHVWFHVEFLNVKKFYILMPSGNSV